MKSSDNAENALFIVDESQLVSDSHYQSFDMMFGTGHLLQDFLTFTGLKETNRKINLDDVLENLTNLITVKAQEKKDLEVLFAIDSDVPRFLVGDSLRLGQVLINLANNAVKFTESGEIVVSTELLTQEKDRVILKFSVRDTGVGLTREQIDRRRFLFGEIFCK